MEAKLETTEKEFRVLMGLASDEFCINRKMTQEEEMLVMEAAAYCALRVSDHITGKDPFDERAVSIMTRLHDMIAARKDNLDNFTKIIKEELDRWPEET